MKLSICWFCSTIFWRLIGKLYLRNLIDCKRSYFQIFILFFSFKLECHKSILNFESKLKITRISFRKILFIIGSLVTRDEPYLIFIHVSFEVALNLFFDEVNIIFIWLNTHLLVTILPWNCWETTSQFSHFVHLINKNVIWFIFSHYRFL